MVIVSKISHLLHPSQGEIWCLHRVVKERSVYPSNRELEITPDYLDSLIADYKGRGYKFVSIDQIVEGVQSKRLELLNRKRVNISFDDGFKDIYDLAFPIFKKYNIPFTVYLTGYFPEGKADIWWVQMERFSGGSVARFEGMMETIRKSKNDMRVAMHEVSSSCPDYSICQHVALSWGQLKEMVDSGLCTVGGHSLTHPGLNRISLKEAFVELDQGKSIIEEHLPVCVQHFSYPYSMDSEPIRIILKKIGYKSAALGYGGKVRKGDDLYRLKRRNIVQNN